MPERTRIAFEINVELGACFDQVGDDDKHQRRCQEPHRGLGHADGNDADGDGGEKAKLRFTDRGGVAKDPVELTDEAKPDDEAHNPDRHRNALASFDEQQQ